MRALTILQPWAEMIARGVKRVENRTWQTKYRGLLAIHVGKSMKWMETEIASEWPERYGVEMPGADELTFGAIIAVAVMVDCVRVEHLSTELSSHPFAIGPFCWVLANARRIEPVYCLGAQHLWKPPLQFPTIQGY